MRAPFGRRNGAVPGGPVLAQLLPLTSHLGAGVDALARSLGHADFAAWAGCESFENRAWPDRIDPAVV